MLSLIHRFATLEQGIRSIFRSGFCIINNMGDLINCSRIG
jgi:hypothetical protein